jgi:excinuclease ABC subunit C
MNMGYNRIMEAGNDALVEKLKTVPNKPGIYTFRDQKERILYIGKARNLKARLKSYFQNTAHVDPRRAAMLQRVKDFTFVITGSELEALALEANLIKQHKPRYNIILRDDKNYPYLKLTTHEEWPRLEVVRRIKKDGSLYFGPYIPASTMWEILSFIRRHFNIRPCRYQLERPIRPCIRYQMSRCPGPCAGLTTREDYLNEVKEVERFLKGEKNELTEELERRMFRLSKDERFEEAMKIRDRLNALGRAFESQKVVAPELGDTDVIGYNQEGIDTVFQIFFIRNGILIGTRDFLLKDAEFIPQEELFSHFIELFYAKEIIPPDEILVQVTPEGAGKLRQWLSKRKGGRVKILLPREGKKRDLIDMASENAMINLRSRKGGINSTVLNTLKERLGLKMTPESIGAFDVSTIFGSFSVGAFVWWEKGEFKKELYRHLKIRDVRGIDDFSMMKEIVIRTARNLGSQLPGLIIIDGGKGHIEAAIKALSEAIGEGLQERDVIGIAKRPDRVITTEGLVFNLDGGEPEALLLRRIRDEVHRFAISFHRKVRDKGLLESSLEKIQGIGKKRRLSLLRHFGSIESIRNASPEQIAVVDGMNRTIAEKVHSALSQA